MAKSFNELSPKAQITVFALLSVLAAGAAWQVLISPERARVAASREQLTKLELEVRGAQAVAMQLPKAQAEADKLAREQAKRDLKKGAKGKKSVSSTRSRATKTALKQEGHAAASHKALSKHAESAAKERTAAERSAAAKKAAKTKGPAKRSAAAKKAARTRARQAET